ncbi:PAS domain S-box protein [Haloferula sp. BvORR071]|uniref:sensor histidine kinase n=1 Tax=Haloferula sp. BvORR071 TaxID=1396141 RepID=UPI0005591E64|nr:PAS domain S-box protein [Haloferula sp. BvORR071]
MPSEKGSAATAEPDTTGWFRTAFARSVDAMALVDASTGEVVVANEAAARSVGYPSPEAMIGAFAGDHAPEFQPDGRRSGEMMREVLRRTVETGSQRFEWQVLAPGGSVTYHDVVATAIPAEGRTLILATARDIAEHKRTEDELRLSGSRWLRAFEQSPVSMQVFAPDGSTLQVNKAYGELFQLTLEDLKGHSIRKDEQLAMAGVLPLIERAFQGEVVTIPPLPFELRASPEQRARGLRWIGSTMFPVLDLRGKLIEVVCIHRDDTARIDAEAEVREMTQSQERIIAERTAELRISEERFKRLFEFSPLGIALVDEHGHFQETNSAFAEMLGYTHDELLEMNYWDINRVKHFPGERTFFDKLQGTGRFGPFDKEYICKDGSAVPVLLHGMRVISSTGEVQIWGIAQDISARKKAERALRDSEEKFKALFEFSPLGMARVSWDGKFLQVNQSFADMIGYTAEEIYDLTYWDVTPRKYEEQEAKILEIVRAHGTFGPFEKEYIHRDGHLVPINLSGMLIRSPDGEDQLWGIAVDTTERTRAELALKESERKFRALFETSAQGVMLHENQLFSAVNPAAARIFGLEPEQLVGMHPKDFAPEFQPDGQPSALAAQRRLEECMEHGTTRFEWAQLHRDGHEVMMEVTLTCIEGGRNGLIQAVVTDISERKRAEMELKRALERERELNQLKNNFVSMVSHEFRTPLGIIQSSAEILADYLERLDAAERQEQLQSIIKNSRRMAGLMEDVLLLGRLDAGRMVFRAGRLDAAALCRRIVDEVNSTSSARCRIRFFTAGLPDEIQADEHLLRHILINLLSNAVKYSEEGEAVVFQAIGTEKELRFHIRDRGIGIPAEDRERLFDAFQRGSNVGQRPGTGLGLVIVKQSVELHGGTIDVESHVGAGTAVEVAIPLSIKPT